MHHVPQAGLTALAVAGPVVQRGVRPRRLQQLRFLGFEQCFSSAALPEFHTQIWALQHRVSAAFVIQRHEMIPQLVSQATAMIAMVIQLQYRWKRFSRLDIRLHVSSSGPPGAAIFFPQLN